MVNGRERQPGYNRLNQAGIQAYSMDITKMTRRGLVALVAGASLLPAAYPQETSPMHHAHGTFTLKMQPLSPAPAEGLARMSISKELQGGFEGTSQGEMISAGNPKTGSAGYVAMELLTGTLDGKHGGFALQHSGTMDAQEQALRIVVAPGSGTGELAGLAGTFTIAIANGQHAYDFEYTLPATK